MNDKLHGYKQTEIELLPEEWEVVKLGSLISDTKNGFASGKRDEKGIVQIRMNNITTDGHILLDSYLKVPAPESINEWILKEGDFLFNNTNSIDLVGKSAIFKSAPFPCTYSNHFTRIRFKQDVLPDWVLYHFIILWRKGFFKSVAIRHVGQAAVHKDHLLKLRLSVPPLPEQKKIAEVLSTVDEGIGKVDQAIEKTERLKKGLMQELLTKGIGHTEFKDTEIGRIPKDWEVVRLNQVADINKESRDPAKEFPAKEFQYIDIDSIENETGVIRNVKTILGKNAPSRARRVVHYNGVIMSTVRPYLKAFAIVPREFDGQICSTGFAVLTCRENMLPLYLLYTLFSKSVINQCNKMMVGAQYPALNNSQVEKIKLPLPLLPEQQKIAEVLSTVHQRVELLKKKKEKLESVKKGLMNDLLSGKKRVKT